MSPFQSPLAPCALAVALLLAAPAQAGKHRITGQIIDRNGQPVDRAVVSLAPGNVQLVTDREGWFLIDYLRDEEGDRTRMQRKTDYALEVFKPGFHPYTVSLYYKRGPVTMEPITLVEETIEVEDHAEDLDPALYGNQTHSAGANYEGQ